jgi:hypothetical protein
MVVWVKVICNVYTSVAHGESVDVLYYSPKQNTNFNLNSDSNLNSNLYLNFKPSANPTLMVTLILFFLNAMVHGTQLHQKKIAIASANMSFTQCYVSALLINE